MCGKGGAIPPSKAYVQALEARIKSLEAQLNSSLAAAVSTSSDLHQDGGMSMSFNQVSGNNESHIPVSVLTGLMGRFNICNDGQLHYFGSQSNYHLTNTLSNQSSIESTVSLQQQGLAAVERLGKGAPLSMELQEHLLRLYWIWQNTGIYIIHKKSFLCAYNNRVYGKYCTPLLLSALFAVSSRFSDRVELRTDPEDQGTAGSAFFDQAKVLFSFECQSATVATVQAAALMSMRALSDGQEALGWLYCGRKRGSSPLLLDNEIEFEPWSPTLEHGLCDPTITMASRAISTGHYAAECLSIASEAIDQM
ncbi:nitrogen assimilation transcription factor nit-4 [Fusarium longipes]|uniref:Nitrogen assimilation transcription factor nit-4 n=1 Tax=Fusarium longipes TaxID=694270 RepID=A0A395SV34_9HYPO|nr:nitrogen assimilation transcription factor nit-4 [Fusarium longipes]